MVATNKKTKEEQVIIKFFLNYQCQHFNKCVVILFCFDFYLLPAPQCTTVALKHIFFLFSKVTHTALITLTPFPVFMQSSTSQKSSQPTLEQKSSWSHSSQYSLCKPVKTRDLNLWKTTYSSSDFFSLLWALCKAALMSSFILSAFRHLWWRASIFLSSGSALRSLHT